METYDLLVLVIILVSLAIGARKGFVWQATTIVSLIVSVIVAARFSGVLAPFFDITPPWNHAVAVLILFLVTSLIINLLFGFVERLIEEWKLKNFDRTVGAILGAIKGLLWSTLLTFFIIMLGGSTGADFVLRSTSGDTLISLIQEVDAVLPENLRNALSGHIEKFEQNLRQSEEESVNIEAVWQQMIAARNLSDLIPATDTPDGGQVSIGPVEPNVPNPNQNGSKDEIGAGGAPDPALAATDDTYQPRDTQNENGFDRSELRWQLMGHAMQLTMAGSRLAIPSGQSLRNQTGKTGSSETLAMNPKTQTLEKKGIPATPTEHKIHYRTLGIGGDLQKLTDRTSSPATDFNQLLILPDSGTSAPSEDLIVAERDPIDIEDQIVADDTTTPAENRTAVNDEPAPIENEINEAVADEEPAPVEDEVVTDDEPAPIKDEVVTDDEPAPIKDEVVTDDEPAPVEDEVVEENPGEFPPADETNNEESIEESGDESSDEKSQDETVLVEISPN